MKGEITMIMLLLSSIILAGAAAYVFEPTDTAIISSGVISATSASSDYIIPKYAQAAYDDTIYIDGIDFRIECDKTIYAGIRDIEAVCEVTNLKNEVVYNKDVKLFFNSEDAKIKSVYYLDNTVKTGEKCYKNGIKRICDTGVDNKTDDIIEICYDVSYCAAYTNVYGEWKLINELDQSADKVYGLTFKEFETKKIKFVIEVPKYSKGKFDIVSGETTLDPWWNAAYPYRIKLTVDNSDSSTPLVNIPVLVHINSSRVDMDDISDDGRDVMFALEDGTQLYHEIDYANSTDYWAWVKVPFISAGSATEYFYAYYNNSAATYDITRIDDVWSNNYTLVMHFSDTNTTGWNTLYDSTGLNSNSTTNGVHTITNGTIAKAIWLSDATSAQYITVADDRNLDNMKSFSAIINYSTFEDGSNWQGLWWWRNATGGATGGYCQFEDDSAPRLYCVGTVNSANTYAYYSTKDKYTGENFIHWNSGDGNIVYYSNGSAVGSNVDADTFPSAVGVNMYIGSEAGGSNPIRAILDEFRWQNTSRSTDWIYADALIQNDTFLSYGLAEGYSSFSSNFTYVNISYSGSMYEHLSSLHQLDIGSNTSLTVSGSLWWNSTEYEAGAYNTTPYNWTLNISILPNFTLTNGEMITSYWNITTAYTNGTTFTNITSSSNTQLLYYGYSFSSPGANSTTVLGGSGLKINSTLTTRGSGTTHNITSVFNNTLYSPSSSGTLYYSEVTAPMVATATTVYYNFGMSITYAGTTIYRNSTTSSIVVSPILLELGSAAPDGVPCIDYRYYKEESPYESMNAEHNAAITIWSSDPEVNVTFNFTMTSNSNHTIFLYPSTASVYAFSIEEYWNDTATDNMTYPVRNYYLNGLHLTSTVQNISLYLLNSSYADVVGFSVVDRLEKPIDDVIIDAQRYYPGENLFRTVARGYTDSDGEAVMRLFKCTDEASVYHKFLLYRDYTVIGSYDQMCLVEDSYILPISEDSVVNYWNVYNDVTGGCTWYNSTQLLLCDFASNEGNSYPVELYVKEFTPVGWDEVCNTTMTGTSGSLTCDLTGMTTEEYYFEFKIIDGTYVHTLESGTLKNVGTGDYGQMGIFIAFLLIIGLAFIGWQSPMIMMLLSIVGITAGMFLGLYEVSIAGLASLIIAGALIMYKV